MGEIGWGSKPIGCDEGSFSLIFFAGWQVVNGLTTHDTTRLINGLNRYLNGLTG